VLIFASAVAGCSPRSSSPGTTNLAEGSGSAAACRYVSWSRAHVVVPSPNPENAVDDFAFLTLAHPASTARNGQIRADGQLITTAMSPAPHGDATSAGPNYGAATATCRTYLRRV